MKKASYQSSIFAVERHGASWWRFLPMTLAIALGWMYLFVLVLGAIEALTPIAETEPFEWIVGLAVLFALFGLPGIGMLLGAWLWFRVRYRVAAVLCGICLLPVVFTVGLVMWLE